MAKRRATEEGNDSEDAILQTASAAKRVRTNTNGDSGTQARNRGNDEESVNGAEEEAPIGEETDEDKIFEARFADSVRAAIEAKSKTWGRVAQHGIIQHIEMHQFMCHPRLSFTFGPQINFIIGHNGSGKSAVLTAITIALGGKAAATGRGNGLKSFIREGQSTSEISITIKNEGEEAYRHETYGDSIIITRRFNKEGSSSYKIKSKDGKQISTKREELSAICDHMNIQVDNPMNVLSQDSARQFLSASHPTDKYHFFLKGTQLSQLSEEYETCLENVGKTFKIIKAKEDAIPDLKKAVTDASARYKNAQKAVEKSQKLNEMKKELAWAHVKVKQNEMTAKIEELAKQERQIPKCEEKITNAQGAVDDTTQAVVALEEQLRELGEIDEINAAKTRINDQIKENRNKLADFASNEKKMSDELKQINRLIKGYEDAIAVETAKLQEDKQAQREEREHKIQAAKADVTSYDSAIREINDQIRELDARRVQLRIDFEKVDKERQDARQRVQDCAVQFDNVKKQMANRLAAYGKNIPGVLERINKERWHGDTPIGPLGDFVALKDKQWQFLMRAQLGSMMHTFAITDARDRSLLKRILNESNNDHIQIIVSQKDMFDYSKGEPAEGFVTVLRALDITNEFVKRILINQNRIERVLLAPTRKDGQAALDALGTPGMAWTSDRHRIQTYGDGGGTTLSITQLHHSDPKNMLFVGRGLDAEMELWKQAGRDSDQQIQAAIAKLNEMHAELKTCNEDLGDLKQQASQLDGKLRDAKRVRDALLAEHNEDVPVNIQALEEAKEEQEENKKSLMNQFQDLAMRKAEVHARQQPLMKEYDQVKAQIAAHEERVGEIQTQILKAVEKRLEAQNKLKHFQNKLEEERKKVATLNEAAKVMQEEFEVWTNAALDLCDGERVENPRKPDEVQQKINGMEKALKEHEREQGATVEQLEEELHLAQKKYEAATADLRDVRKLCKVIKASMVVRLQRWHDFRRHIALRTKLQFQYHLSVRGFYGKVLFDHVGQKLELKVQTDEQAATQGPRDKDPRSLSGGEKSFATVCLLLSLWEAIGCPIRCLDEFDVFMDAVNRRVSMKMMIDTANASDSKQYILITPQDMSTVSFGPSVRVHRMGDPERGQNTLTF